MLRLLPLFLAGMACADPNLAVREKYQDGAGDGGITWHLRIPKAYDAKKGGPALVVMHGSNMNSMDYLKTIEATWPKLAQRFVLIGLNGETKAQGSTDENPAFNFTFDSPPLVAATVKKLREQLKLTRVLLGGHSQGGCLAFATAMEHPEICEGIWPVSGMLWSHVEPAGYEDASKKTAQRRVAIVIVHGENDPVVEFSMGEAAWGSYVDECWPAARFLTHPTAAHMFAVLPVEEAIDWLDAMTSPDAATVMGLAEASLKAKRPRDAWAAAARAEGLKAPAGRVKAVRDAVEKEAAAAAKPLGKAMAAPKDSWVKDFTAFRERYDGTAAAAPLVKAYLAMREKHEKPAEKLFFEARGDFQKDDEKAAYAKYEEIVAKYYASSWYRYAKSSLEERARK